MASNTLRRKLDEAPWTIDRIRRIYAAAKNPSGKACPSKKGTALRAVERLASDLSRDEALAQFSGLATEGDEVEKRRGITYIYRHMPELVFPTREEFFVASPAVVETKARYGLDSFDRKWEDPQGSLFMPEQAA